MNPLRFVTLKAEDVAAVYWETSSEENRRGICRIGGISDVIAILGWHDLQLTERVPLTIVIKGLIEDAASRLRRVARPINQLSA